MKGAEEKAAKLLIRLLEREFKFETKDSTGGI
jgi:hypothetical protein